MKKYILVVDDDGRTRSAVSELLLEEGYVARVAAGGQEALDTLAEGLPDLVVTDLGTARLDGEELIAELRCRAPQAPIIALTSHASIDARREASRLGADAYLNKPIDLDELLARISQLL